MITKTELGKENIKYYSNTGMPLEEIIKNEIDSWLNEKNKKRNLMITGENYYKGIKLEIDNKDRYFIGKNGMKIRDNENRRNNKLKHNFFKKLVNQKVGYLLSNGVMPNTDNDKYQEELEERLDEEFTKRFINTAREAIYKGIAWWQVYYKNGQLKFTRIPSEELIPLWANREHTSLDAIIRVYEVDVYEGKNMKVVTKVEYYDTNGVKRYIYEKGNLIEDVENPNNYHFRAVRKIEDEEGNEIEAELGLNWSKVPFIYFKYNEFEIPLIQDILSLGDDYNRKRSEFADILSDAVRAILIVRNYDGEDLAEFNENIFKHFAAKVSDDGNVDKITLDIDSDAHKTHINQLRQDIFEFGRGVDLDNDKFGNSPSGIALKILYNDLDMDCNDFATELKASLNYLLYFINVDIANNPNSEYKATLEELENTKVEFNFEKNMLTNELDLIEALEKSSLSERTKVEKNPYAAEDEMDRIEKERKETFEDMLDYPKIEGIEKQEEE